MTGMSHKYEEQMRREFKALADTMFPADETKERAMMKNDCGHPVSSEESLLCCADCESERRKAEDAALWNAAIEAAALKCETADVPIDISVWAGSRKGLSAATATGLASIIRALKREAKGDAPERSTEGLWDIVHELKERPCEHGNDCRPKVDIMHPCLPCAARMEWEAK